MVEPAILKFLNERIAELTKQCESRENREILEELSELTIIRDELKKISNGRLIDLTSCHDTYQKSFQAWRRWYIN